MALPPKDYRRRTRFIVKLGRALHQCGATSDRIECHLTNVTEMLEIHGSFLVSPTTLTCAFWEDDELDQFIYIERVESPEYNLGRLWEIDPLVESIEMGKFDFEEGLLRLKALHDLPPNYSQTVVAIASTLLGAALRLFFPRILLMPSARVSFRSFFISFSVSLVLGLGGNPSRLLSRPSSRVLWGVLSRFLVLRLIRPCAVLCVRSFLSPSRVARLARTCGAGDLTRDSAEYPKGSHHLGRACGVHCLLFGSVGSA